MNPLRWLRRAPRALFRRNHLDTEMAEEMRSHISMQAELNETLGMSPVEARAAAQKQFGHLAGLEEKGRDARGVTWLLDLWGDVRFALRMLGKNPGFALTVIVTLSLGIATNTNMFAMINNFFLQPLPLANSSRLVLLTQRNDLFNLPHSISFPTFRDFREGMKSVTNLIAVMPKASSISLPGKVAERGWIQIVTPDAFTRLQVKPALGRTLLASDGESLGSSTVAVVSHAFWQNRLGGSPDVIGQTVTLNGSPFTIVGVANPEFRSFAWGMQMSLFVPTGALDRLVEDGNLMLENRTVSAWRVMGTLAPSFTVDDARAEVEVLSRRLLTDHAEAYRNTSFGVVTEQSARPDVSVSDYTSLFAWIFAGLVLLVLFIACANVANLMIARAVNRERELAMRAALGASRLRLLRMLIVEALVLAAVAGAMAWVLSDWVGTLLQQFSPKGDLPIAPAYEPDWRHYAFATGISLLTGVLSGLIPALRGSRTQLVDAIKQGSATIKGHGKHRLRNLLVTGQVASSLIVLVGAGLFLISLRKAQSANLGFVTQNLLLMSADLQMQGYDKEKGERFLQDLLVQVRALPGVRDATLARHVPFDYNLPAASIWPDNPPSHLKDGSVGIAFNRVEPGYFEMMGISPINGRTLQETDHTSSPNVAVVNETMARLCWPGQDALGKRFRLFWKEGPWVEVVGIVPTGKYAMLGEAPRPYAFLALRQGYSPQITLLVRSNVEASALTESVRGVFTALDSELPVFNVSTMDDHLGSSVFGFMPLRAGVVLAGVQGLIGLFLAVLGLYSVVSYDVGKRTQEIGIRVALGATSRQVMKLVLTQGLRLTLVGLALGGIFAFGLGLVLSKTLYGVPPFHFWVFACVTLILVGTTLIACWVPAHRAVKLNPVDALRTD